MLIDKENQRRSRKTQEHVCFLKTYDYSTMRKKHSVGRAKLRI